MASKKQMGVLVASGGIDSTVLMYKLAKEGKLAEVVFCDYGQASRRRQIDLLKYHTEVVGVPLFIQKIPYPKYLMRKEVSEPGFTPKAKATMERMISLKESEARDFLVDEHVYLDGRNTLFLLFSALRATYLKVPCVYTGFQHDSVMWEGDNAEKAWGDTSQNYVSALNLLFEESLLQSVKVVCPFYDTKMDKESIVKLGRRLNVNLNKTYSCDFYPACGRCVTCSQALRVGIHQTPRTKNHT